MSKHVARKDDGMQCELMTVTPAMASNWLEHANSHNRKMLEPAAERIAQDIRDGAWKTTHQGIAFDSGGSLLDGQQRLLGVVLADKPAKMYVWLNVPTTCQYVMDQGRTRTSADALTLRGGLGRVSTRELAVLRAMLRGFGTAKKLSVTAEGRALRKHRKAITFSREHLGRRGGIPGVITAATHAVVARAYYSADHTKLEHFCEVLKTGLGKANGDRPIGLLIRQLARCYGLKGHMGQKVRYGRIERALDACLRGQDMQRLYPTKKELFPLPEEVAVSHEGASA